MKRYLIGLSILVFLLFPLPAQAAEPLAVIQAEVNKVLDVLRDKSLTTEVKKEKLRTLYSEMFDEVELSRRALGANWKKLSPSQQEEFVPLFRQILEKAYINKILSYTDQKIVFARSIMSSDSLGEVQTKVITSSQETPLNYRVILKDGTWKVYDVVIENVSLVMNYRSQFESILARNTPEQMIEILQKKVKEK